ncbi:MAG TPA: c-type cytochrome [Gemmatimonadaceae bacterium]|nr:c-type cytochrome [Gemmatimonadaceae bacterium]
MSVLKTRGNTLRLWLVAVLLAPASSGAQSLSAFSRQKAERLLKDHLPCLGCHKLNGDGGTIGPDLTTVRERRSPAYIAAMINDPQRVVPGAAMPRILMPESTRRLIIQYLGERPGSATDDGAAGARPATPDVRAARATTQDGPALYARLCASCHGTNGKGDGPNASNLPVKPAVHSSGDAMSSRPDDSLFDTIASGGAVMNRSPRMPAFGATLSASEIRVLVRHIRTLCRCEGPSWSRK